MYTYIIFRLLASDHKYIYIYIIMIDKYILDIYIFNPWKMLFCELRFLEVYKTFIRQLRRWNEIENRKCHKIQTKNLLGFRLCVVVRV